MICRQGVVLIVAAATLLAACGTPAPPTREAELGATIAALEATIAAGSPDTQREPAPPATAAPPADIEGTNSAQLTIQSGDATSTGDEASPEATVIAEATVKNPEVVGPGAVTAIMQELALAGEPFAAEGDPNAPLTIIEFSDYG